MRRPFYLVILSIITIYHQFYLAFSFGCSDISKQNYCIQLKGCSWEENLCKGTYAPSCMPPECYYIDSSTTSTTPTGSPDSPFQSISKGFAQLGTKDGTLIILNYKDKTTVDIEKTVTLTSEITIKYL